MPKVSVQVGRPVRRRRRRTTTRRRVRRGRRVPRGLPAPTRMQVFRRVVNSAQLQLTAVDVNPVGATINKNASGLFAVGTGSIQQTYYATFALAFKLEDIPGYSVISGGYERYKIAAVKIRCVPINNVSATAVPYSASVNGGFGGFIHHCIDYDDYAIFAPDQTGIDAMGARTSYRMSRFTRGFTRVIKPKVASNVYSGGLLPDGYVSIKPPWIHNTTTDVEHYGFKAIFEMFNPAAQSYFANFKFEVFYYVLAQSPIY